MTQRTKSQLDVLLADNTSGDISPADLRDFLDSTTPSRGAIHFTDTATPTAIVTQNTPTKASNTGTLVFASRFSMPGDGQLRYDGAVAIAARLAISMSLSLVSGSGDVVSAALAINGSVLVPSIMRTKLGSAGDVQAMSLLVDAPLNPSDVIELYLTNESSTADVLVSHGYMTALGFLT